VAHLVWLCNPQVRKILLPNAELGHSNQPAVKAYPSPKMTIASWWINTTTSATNTSIYEPAAYLHSLFPNLNAKGVQGYYFVYPKGMQGIFLTAGNDAGAVNAKRTWAPILGALSTFSGMAEPIQEYADVSSYKAFYDRAFGPLESMKDMPGMSGTQMNIEDGSTGLLKRGFLREANNQFYKMYRRHGPDGDDEPMAAAGPAVDKGPVSIVHLKLNGLALNVLRHLVESSPWTLDCSTTLR
jgi:hypothetical protein